MVLKKIDSVLGTVQAIDSRGAISGLNILSGASSSTYGVGFIKLKDQTDRVPRKSIDQVIGEITGKTNTIKEASVFLFQPPTVQGFGNTSGFEVIIQDRTGGPLKNLGKVTNEFIGELYKRKEIAFAFTSFNTNNPQYLLNIDNAKAKQLNVSVANILGTMQVYFGSSFVSDFNRFGKYYRVIVEADIPYRMDPTAMDGIFVKNTAGQMIPLNELVSLERVYGPETVNRTNLFNSTTINGSVKPGYSSGMPLKQSRKSLPLICPADILMNGRVLRVKKVMQVLKHSSSLF